MLKCSDKIPINRRDTAGNCFRKGISVGVAVGVKLQKEKTKKMVKKIKKKAVKKMRAVEAITRVIANRDIRTIPLGQATKNNLETLAMRNGITSYRNKTKDQLINELRQKGITSIRVPR